MQKINYSVQRVNLYESIADNLEQMILNDSSQIGQRLPSEQTLAENFGVSRNVVRESLKILKERHLVSLRTGEGAYIEKPDNRSLTELLNRIILLDNVEHGAVMEVRRIIETEACRLAAERNAPEAFDVLDEINASMMKYKEDIEKRISLDIQFHITIAKLSHNPLLELFAQSMANLLAPILRTALIPEGGNENGIEFHKQIIATLRSQDGEKAEKLMRQHLEESVENYYSGEQ
ncbi:MAG: FadR family transcriptional regulator [Kineothrix sp.]|nr:FadR family transcriptional regulator [Kineothrix sp.]